MVPSLSLVIDSGRGGEQLVRRPRRTDAIGASLRGAFAIGPRMPDDLSRLLHLLDQATPGDR